MTLNGLFLTHAKLWEWCSCWFWTYYIEYPGLSLNVFLFLAGLGKEYHEYSNLAFFDYSFIHWNVLLVVSAISLLLSLWPVWYSWQQVEKSSLSFCGSSSKRVGKGSVRSARKILLINAFCMDLLYWFIFCWKYTCSCSAHYSIQWRAHVKDHCRAQHNVVLVLMFTSGLCIQVLWYEMYTPEDMQNVVFYKQVVFAYRQSLDQDWLL